MIRPEELRIGNHLQNGIVVEIRLKNVTVDDGTTVWKSMNGLQLEPTPITEEWLLKAGFEKRPPSFESYPLHPYWVKNGVILFFNEGDPRNTFLLGFAEIRMGKYHVVGTRWINYLHDFQNGYQIFTGEELQFKL